MDANSLESNLEGDYAIPEKQLKAWEKRWNRFHRALPDRVDLGGIFFYKQERDSGLYMMSPPEEPLKRRRWYWPFWPI